MTAVMTNALALTESKALRPLRDVDPKSIIQRYLSDESTKDIAASYGITRQALGQFLIKACESDWKDAQVARAIARKEAAEDDLETAPDVLSLARARERLRGAQWDLERVCRRIYGQDAPTVAQAVQININLRREGATNAVQHEHIQLDASKDAE